MVSFTFKRSTFNERLYGSHRTSGICDCKISPFWRDLQQKKTSRKKYCRFDLPTEAKRPNIIYYVIYILVNFYIFEPEMRPEVKTIILFMILSFVELIRGWNSDELFSDFLCLLGGAGVGSWHRMAINSITGQRPMWRNNMCSRRLGPYQTKIIILKDLPSD